MAEADSTRRTFLKSASLGAAVLTLLGCLPQRSPEPGGVALPQRQAVALPAPGRDARPNILWISTEDISPDLGCYGDAYAVTPNLDRFAARGTRFEYAFASAGVCAPARSAIITGMYASSIGTNPMRCRGVPPPQVKCFPEYLRAAGYYCTNRSKTDYQFQPPLTAWDESSRRAHWRNRPKGRPFFSVINIGTTHESQIRSDNKGLLKRIAALGPQERHDPARATLPPYYPDTPVVRRDWARYYDIITLMDREVAAILKQLEDDGLADDTIVWFWGDHGRGLPRGKRWLYDSGLRVPLIIHVPKKFRGIADLAPGAVSKDLVSFVDFGPTVLSLAGVKVPDYMQGRPFLGRQKAKPRRYIFGARDRMDEAYDLIRVVRDKRFKYIRNFMPHLTYGLDIWYMNKMPTMQEMRRLHAAGKLQGVEASYFRPTKPVEELYDTVADPHEVRNLADDPKYGGDLRRLRRALWKWMEDIGDVGLIPEPDFDEMKRPGGKEQKTAEPLFYSRTKKPAPGQAITVSISCATAGASIAFRTDGKQQTRAKTGWELYHEPIKLKPGQTLVAKAVRIGFRESRAVRFEPGAAAGATRRAQSQSDSHPHWREQLDGTDLLKRLRTLKALDGEGDRAIPAYFKALDDPDGPVRYWAVVGLHNALNKNKKKQESGTITRAKAAWLKRLEDSSPSVRVAAARALCDWGEEARALPVLVDVLKSGSNTARLFAATALGQIGEKARPALSDLQAAMKDKFKHVNRVTRYTLERLQ